MSLPIATKTQGPVGADAVFQTRQVSPDATGQPVPFEGNCLTAADVATITCAVYDLDAGDSDGTPVAQPTVNVAASILPLAVTNEWMNRDTIGRNFRHQVSGSVFATAEHTYRVVYTLTTNGGATIPWAHDHTTTALVPS